MNGFIGFAIIVTFFIFFGIIALFVYQGEQMSHFGKIETVFEGTCVKPPSAKCGAEGQKVTVFRCVENKSNNFGCIYNGQQVKNYFEKVESCQTTCVKQEWVNDNVVLRPPCKILLGTGSLPSITTEPSEFISPTGCVDENANGWRQTEMTCNEFDSDGLNNCSANQIQSFLNSSNQVIKLPSNVLYDIGDKIYINEPCKDFNLPVCGNYNQEESTGTYVFSNQVVSLSESPNDTLSYGFVISQGQCLYNKTILSYNNITQNVEDIACINKCVDKFCKIGNNCQTGISVAYDINPTFSNTVCQFTGTNNIFYENVIYDTGGTYTLSDYTGTIEDSVYTAQIAFKIPNITIDVSEISTEYTGTVYGQFCYIIDSSNTGLALDYGLNFTGLTNENINILQEFLVVKKDPGYLFARIGPSGTYNGIQILEDNSTAFYQGPIVFTDPYLDYNTEPAISSYYYSSSLGFTKPSASQTNLPVLNNFKYAVDLDTPLKTIGIGNIILYVIN